MNMITEAFNLSWAFLVPSGGRRMRRSTKLLLPFAGLIILALLSMPTVMAGIGGEDADRSMITTESGEDRFFLESKDGSMIVWDMS